MFFFSQPWLNSGLRTFLQAWLHYLSEKLRGEDFIRHSFIPTQLDLAQDRQVASLTCKTIHSVFNLDWEFACQSTFYIRIQIPSGGNRIHLASEEDKEQLYINRSCWSPWGEAWGAARCSPGPPHLLPALYPPHCFAPLLLLYLLTSDCWILSISLNANLLHHPSPFHPPPPHTHTFSVLLDAASSSTPFFFLCPSVNISRTHRKVLFFFQQMEQLLLFPSPHLKGIAFPGLTLISFFFRPATSLN